MVFFGYIIKKLTGTQIKIMKPQLWMLIGGIILFFGFAVLRNVMVYQFGYDYLGDLI